MLTRIDRIQLAVPDLSSAAEGWVALLGAEPAGEDRCAALGARRTRLRLGSGWIELLEPDGAGPVADAVAKRGGHLFAAGAATSDLDALVSQLRDQGAAPVLEHDQVFLAPAGLQGQRAAGLQGQRAAGLEGLRMVFSPEQALEPVGDAAFLYEVTLLVRDAVAAADQIATLLRLDADAFVPIESKHYGYKGTLTLFDRDRLDRLEVITPNQPDNTMGRFFARAGESFYMAFAESENLEAIAERARDRRAGHTPVPATSKSEDRELNTLFLHPSALGGMMLGLSAPSVAWQWSGHPERVHARNRKSVRARNRESERAREHVKSGS